ncbi:MAG: hypothetical protein MK098_04810 [Marinovum sp.]|nr:hypothetical protein [Marinovum sp.]
MTPDRALRQGILGDATPYAATAKRMRRERKPRRITPLWFRLILRLAMLAVSAMIARFLMYTPEGQAIMQDLAFKLADHIGPLIAGNRGGEAVSVFNPTQAGAEAAAALEAEATGGDMVLPFNLPGTNASVLPESRLPVRRLGN